MSKTACTALLAYVYDHWSERHDNVRYSKKLWHLVDVAKQDKQSALCFVVENLRSTDAKNGTAAALLAGQICNPVEKEDEENAQIITSKVLDLLEHVPYPTKLNLVRALDKLVPCSELTKCVLAMTYDSNNAIKTAAVISLVGIIGNEPGDNEVVLRLNELTTDVDSEVREWSTFGLVTCTELSEGDQQTIRDALFARINDRHLDTRAEAFMGLALSGDDRGVEPLRRYLSAGKRIGKLNIEAAHAYGRSELYEPLLEISKWWDVDKHLLSQAVAACKPN